jgi:hypothetical protein
MNRRPQGSGFLDFGSDLVYDLFEFLFLGAFAHSVFAEKRTDLAAEILTLFGGEQKSGTGAYDSAAEEGIK